MDMSDIAAMRSDSLRIRYFRHLIVLVGVGRLSCTAVTQPSVREASKRAIDSKCVASECTPNKWALSFCSSTI